MDVIFDFTNKKELCSLFHERYVVYFYIYEIEYQHEMHQANDDIFLTLPPNKGWETATVLSHRPTISEWRRFLGLSGMILFFNIEKNQKVLDCKDCLNYKCGYCLLKIFNFWYFIFLTALNLNLCLVFQTRIFLKSNQLGGQ